MPGNHTTHGLSKTPEYRIWQGMKKRCYNVNGHAYDRYGGRGIEVCAEWLDFATFYRDMGPRPSPDHSLERRRNHEGYSKENCVWGTRKEQCNNRRSNILLTFKGKTQTLQQWCDELGLNYSAVYYRVKTMGLTGRSALFGKARRIIRPVHRVT